MPTEHQSMIHEKYLEFMNQRKKEKKKKETQDYPKPPEGKSPRKLGIIRDKMTAMVELTEQKSIPGGLFWFGTQTEVAGKILPDTDQN